jgi:hypothetical protein
MPLADFAARFGAELAEVAAGNPARPAGQVMSDAFQMYRRHGIVVDRVAKAALGEAGDHILNTAVPAGSLLAAILQSGVVPTPESVGDVVGDEDEPRLDPEHPIFPLRLIFHADAGPTLHIKGLGEFRGAHLGMVGGLKPYLEEDVEAGLPPDRHRWIPTGRLGNKGTVRQHARRCRDEFADQYEAVEGRRPDSHLLVHTNSPKGYRLDPEARFLEK